MCCERLTSPLSSKTLLTKAKQEVCCQFRVITLFMLTTAAFITDLINVMLSISVHICMLLTSKKCAGFFTITTIKFWPISFKLKTFNSETLFFSPHKISESKHYAFIFISPKDVSYLTIQPILSARTLVHAEFSISVHFFQPFHFHPLKILIFPDSVHVIADSEAKKLDQTKKRNPISIPLLLMPLP